MPQKNPKPQTNKQAKTKQREAIEIFSNQGLGDLKTKNMLTFLSSVFA